MQIAAEWPQDTSQSIVLISYDESKATCLGLGYKVIRYVEVSPNEPYQNNIGVKMGNWFIKYKLPIDIFIIKKIILNIRSLDDFYDTQSAKNSDIRNLEKI